MRLKLGATSSADEGYNLLQSIVASWSAKYTFEVKVVRCIRFPPPSDRRLRISIFQTTSSGRFYCSDSCTTTSRCRSTYSRSFRRGAFSQRSSRLAALARRRLSPYPRTAAAPGCIAVETCHQPLALRRRPTLSASTRSLPLASSAHPLTLA